MTQVDPNISLYATNPRRSLLITIIRIIILLSMLMAAFIPPAIVHAAEAEQAQSGRLLRLGLEKSAVLKLPGTAKDVIVGNTDLVDVVLKNRNTAYLFARKPGQTNVFFLDAAGRQILQLNLEVTLDTKPLKALLDRSLPGSAIQVDSTGQNVVLKGSVKDAQQGKTAEDLAKRFMATYQGGDGSVVNLLTIAQGNQVILKVKVVELKRTAMKRIGVDLNGKLGAGPVSFSFNNSTSFIEPSLLMRGVLSFPGPPVDINARIRALVESGLATILAEPSLTAISGAPASFHAGGQYPYSTCDFATNNTQNLTCTTEFRDYGITLDFTPTVLSEGRIALNIYTEVSDLGPNEFNANQPIIDTRNAQTSVELPTGGSMMLAGLIKNSSIASSRYTPGLRNLPIVGAMFSNQNFDRKQTELVVIVTPYIVGPTGEENLATPLDRFNNATDMQHIFLGRLSKVYGLPEGSGAAQGSYHGQVGHIVE